MRIGVDLGGTKIEAVALDDTGSELAKQRVATPRGNYPGTLDAIAELVSALEQQTGQSGTVGVGMPGSFSTVTGVVRNANSTWLIGQPFDHDLQARLGREVRFANDANCLAVSEAVDGAGAGAAVVFAVILGTGVGGGVALNGKVHNGHNAIGGEWGHNPLGWMEPEEFPGPDCYCGKRGCIETFVSGTGFEQDFLRTTGERIRGLEIVARAASGDADADAALQRYEHRLARSIATLANVLDPDVFVLGGGMSNLPQIYETLSRLVPNWTLGGEFTTPIRPAKHGDSSGVRGAAWLW
ncbi:MAG: fructokinase [SAR324 cluster bacterium]|jgi:fructokinase|nr:fructokinase [SAR324 cluster bacterium]MEC7416715.1 fructokinase [SAR324 cluster bacterium]HIF68419.1 fructokinase [Candidatus Lambdaproteobacteria bacterium]HIL14788.1 fructokinase [Deltaproteobacteria bacterium]